MYYTIYQTTNIVNGKIYIGKHETNNLTDGYLGSGKLLKEAIKKYGREKFEKTFLFIFDNPSDMNKKEKELITEEFVNRRDTYNLGIGGEGGPHFKGKNHSDETKKKLSNISKKQSKHIKTDEQLKKERESRLKKNNGKWHSEKTIEKLRLAANKTFQTEETKVKISKSIKELMTEDRKNALRRKMIEVYSNKELRDKMSSVMKGKGKGSKWLINDQNNHCFRCPAEEIEKFLSEGYRYKYA